jgi:hypothetical protein
MNYIEYPEDCLRIKNIALMKCNIDLSLFECVVLWERYSNSVCAGWMLLPKSDEALAGIISEFLQVNK